MKCVIVQTYEAHSDDVRSEQSAAIYTQLLHCQTIIKRYMKGKQKYCETNAKHTYVKCAIPISTYTHTAAFQLQFSVSSSR